MFIFNKVQRFRVQRFKGSKVQGSRVQGSEVATQNLVYIDSITGFSD
jgi:hypothetical protein